MGFLVSAIREFKNKLKQKLKDNYIRIYKENYKADKLYILAAVWRRRMKKRRTNTMKFELVSMDLRHSFGKQPCGGEEGFFKASPKDQKMYAWASI